MAQSNIIRYFSLFILTFQNAATVLVMRYSRKQTNGKDLYIGTTLILTSEIVKLVLCILLLIYQRSGSLILTWRAVTSEVFFKPWETAKLAIPSSLYTLQNNLNVFALSFLDAATYQVTYQLKILTTAFFAVILLRKELRPLQWLSLIILMAGVILVQFPSGSKSKENEPSDENSTTNYWHLVGLIAVLASSLSSGFAGVYYEKLLKESSQPSVIIRNIQLGIFSIIFATAGVFLNDWSKIVQRGFFSGYTDVVWVVIMLQATGGLLVAAVIKYADNILKGFASSVSIIISCLISYVVFNDLNLNLTFVLGTGFVMSATFLYGIQSHQPSTGSIQIISSNNTSRFPKMYILSPPHPNQDDLVSIYKVENIIEHKLTV